LPFVGAGLSHTDVDACVSQQHAPPGEVTGWHGVAGDRRYAVRSVGDRGSFPWVSASRFPEMVLYQPIGLDESQEEPLPTHVRTPWGEDLELGSDELDSHLSEKIGSAVELTRAKHGIFDEAALSVISSATISAIAEAVGVSLDHRRFRANIVIQPGPPHDFIEDGWVGGRLVFGKGAASAAVSVTCRDLRCVMVNIDPSTAEKDARRPEISRWTQ